MFRKNSVILSAILVSAFIPYVNVFNAPFVFDDVVIYNFLNFRRFIEIRSITENTFALNFLFHGLWLPGFHFVNIAIHALNGVLIYLFMVQIYKTPFLKIREDSAKKYSFLIALLFLSHPIQIQSVTFLSQRYTSLVTFFILASLNTYLMWRLNYSSGNSKTKSFGVYAIAIIIAMCSVKVKELAVVLPLLITLCEFTFFSGKTKSRLIYVLPFYLILPLVVLNAFAVRSVTFAGQMQTQYVLSDNTVQAAIEYDVKSPLIAKTRIEYLFTQLRVIVTYLRMLVLPVNLTLVHYYPVSRGFFELKVIFSFLFLLAIFLTGCFMFSQGFKQNNIQKSLISFGIFWFFIGIFPQSGLINKYGWTIFEYRVYLASAGFFIASFFLLLHFFRNREAFIYLITAIIVFNTFFTFYQNRNWKSEVLLWRDNVKKEPLHPVARIQLGMAYAGAKLFKDALRELETAQQMEPEFPEIPYQIGNVFAQEGQFDKAIEQYDKSISINPYLPFSHFSKGKVLAAKNMWPESIKELKLSLKYGNYSFELYHLLAHALTMTGNITEAINEYKNTLKLYPQSAETHNALGHLYTQTGNYTLADTEIMTALKLNSKLYEGYNNLGVLYASTGKMTEAVNEFKRAIAIQGDYITGFKNLANAYLALNRFDDAADALNKALEISPQSPEILTTTGNMHLLAGNKTMAEEYYLKALQINPSYVEAQRNMELTK
ncbi:MAG: tetratricopeptide repeat protein [Nitrospirae bacterium YQR-1]